MQSYEIIFIAVALAMDAFAVSIASGVTIKRAHISHAFRIALWFGLFQAVMPVLGWLLASWASGIFEALDHWIAFGLLTFIGAKMIYEAFKLKDAEEARDLLKTHVLLILSIATSIDAFAVGISFAVLKVSILTPVLVIGGVTFVLSMIGVWLGNKLGHFFEKKIEIIGGLILIGVGVKILVEHLGQGG